MNVWIGYVGWAVLTLIVVGVVLGVAVVVGADVSEQVGAGLYLLAYTGLLTYLTCWKGGTP